MESMIQFGNPNAHTYPGPTTLSAGDSTRWGLWSWLGYLVNRRPTVMPIKLYIMLCLFSSFVILPRYSGVRSLQNLFSPNETRKTRPHFNWLLKMSTSSENNIIRLNVGAVLIANHCSYSTSIPAYCTHSNPVLMEAGSAQYQAGTASWRRNGWITWLLISSALPPVAHWVLSNTLLPVDMDHISGTECAIIIKIVNVLIAGW